MPELSSVREQTIVCELSGTSGNTEISANLFCLISTYTNLLCSGL